MRSHFRFLIAFQFVNSMTNGSTTKILKLFEFLELVGNRNVFANQSVASCKILARLIKTVADGARNQIVPNADIEECPVRNHLSHIFAANKIHIRYHRHHQQLAAEEAANSIASISTNRTHRFTIESSMRNAFADDLHFEANDVQRTPNDYR